MKTKFEKTGFKIIESGNNSALKEIRKISKSSNYRDKKNLIMLEGLKLCKEYLNLFPKSHVSFYVKENSLNYNKNILFLRNYSIKDNKIYKLKKSLFSTISSLSNGDGIIAICKKPVIKKIIPKKNYCIFLEKVQDPGNLGSILRSAVSFNCSKVFLSKDSCDPWSPKSIRGGMGAQLKIKIVKCDLEAEIKKYEGPLIAIVPSTEDFLRGPFKNNTGFVFGSEGEGLSGKIAKLIESKKSISIKNMESLNLSVAVSITCYEFLRKS